MLTTIFRTAVFYFVVVICMRLMGKRQVGELQPGELVVTILISELASIPMQDLNRPITNGIIAILVLVILEIILSQISLISLPFRRLLTGKSVVIISGGVIDQKMLRKLRVNLDDLLESVRAQGCFDLSQIDYAVMETGGKVSVLQKPSVQPVTRADMNINGGGGMPVTVISDGRLMRGAFEKDGKLTRTQVDGELNRLGLKIKEVFLMTADKDMNFYTVKKQ